MADETKRMDPDSEAARKVLHASLQRCRVHFMRNALAHVGPKQRQMVAAAIRTGPVLEAGVPRLLFEWPIGMGYDREYDVTPDGERFVVVGPADPTATEASRPRIRVVLNWVDELKRLVPTGQ